MQVFKALSCKTKLEMLKKLLSSDVCCNDVVRCSGLDASTVSRHLRDLERANLITIERKGKNIRCSVKNRKLVSILLEYAQKIEVSR
ncbi:MAG: metalloregulator ArsR/SmtB family transcription factor [Candidatus Micrarchaeota archaeon]